MKWRSASYACFTAGACNATQVSPRAFQNNPEWSEVITVIDLWPFGCVIHLSRTVMSWQDTPRFITDFHMRSWLKKINKWEKKKSGLLLQMWWNITVCLLCHLQHNRQTVTSTMSYSGNYCVSERSRLPTFSFLKNDLFFFSKLVELFQAILQQAFKSYWLQKQAANSRKVSGNSCVLLNMGKTYIMLGILSIFNSVCVSFCGVFRQKYF